MTAKGILEKAIELSKEKNEKFVCEITNSEYWVGVHPRCDDTFFSRIYHDSGKENLHEGLLIVLASIGLDASSQSNKSLDEIDGRNEEHKDSIERYKKEKGLK